MPFPDLATLASEKFCYLTTIGRVTGRRHTIEIWFLVHDDEVWMLNGSGARSDTVRNLQAHPEVRLRIGSATTVAVARVVDGLPPDAPVREAIAAKYRTDGDDLVSWSQTALPVALRILF
ncbi:MAG: pyridoxamine 5-phosphate oxidase-related, FMN-binding [Actinomycetia bacterium]|nr:pyridoxamine 5-phosphate oxidase-related, FMN-binding [Actinomycetes bacterium]